MIVEVIAKVEEIESKKSLTSNSFYHVFVAPNDVAAVLPENYHSKDIKQHFDCVLATKKNKIYLFSDSMLYIDGRRRYLDFVAHLEKQPISENK